MNVESFRNILFRESNSNKYDYGHILVIGGTPGMVGAPILVAQAALRTGAGLATIASTPDVIFRIEDNITEIMTLRTGFSTLDAIDNLLDFVTSRKVNVISIGSGMHQTSYKFIRSLISEVGVPVIIDAAAIMAYKGYMDTLVGTQSTTNMRLIFTPHKGEFNKLIPSSKNDDWHRSAQDISDKYKVVVVCKGDHSLVVSPINKSYMNITGDPGMATAGSGDVLTGVIAGLIGQGLGTFEAASAGVYLHGLAADLAVEDLTQPALIASDIINYIPAAYKNILSQLT